MKLAALRAKFRRDADDRDEQEQQFLFPDGDVDSWLNEAEDEACKRKDLIHEAQDAGLCTIATTASVCFYDMHAKMLRPTRITWTPTGSECTTELVMIDRAELDRIQPYWREDTEPGYVIVEDQRLRLGWIPCEAGSLQLEGWRLPLEPMGSDNAEPEIGEAHHAELVHWALHKAFRTPDGEALDPNRSKEALADFERYFGLKKDAERGRPPAARLQTVQGWF